MIWWSNGPSRYKLCVPVSSSNGEPAINPNSKTTFCIHWSRGLVVDLKNIRSFFLLHCSRCSTTTPTMMTRYAERFPFLGHHLWERCVLSLPFVTPAPKSQASFQFWDPPTLERPDLGGPHPPGIAGIFLV